MGNYTIQSTAINKDRVFILQKSELEKRWDTYYYLPEFIVLEEKLKNKNIKKISQIAERIFSGSTPLSKGDAYTDNKVDGIPFVRSGDFTIEGTINFEDLVYLKEEVHNTQLKSSKLKRNDLLFAIVGATIGKVGVYKNDKPANINQAICAVRLKKEFNVDYLNAYFQTSIGQKLIDRIKRPVARANVNIDEISTLPVIIPNNETQQKIISIFNNSLAQKQQNEAEADKLLASIDDYLLNELGINLPEPPENTLKNRMFTRTLSEIQNKRVDPFFHQDKFINNLTAISNGKYPVKQLRDIISGNLIKGSLPKQDEKDGEYSVVQINSINADGTIALDDLLTAKNIFSNQQKLKVGDVLVVITGATIGKIAFWNYEGDYFLGGDIVKFQTNSLSDNAFVYHFLRCSLMQTEIKRNITGATNGHLAPEDIAHLPIPIPPLTKQQEIADHITSIRQQAQQLKDKTSELLKQASEEIEKILLN
ncbi:MAG: hypothetical protein GX292_03630 [Bacteroidales bacterium]|jgi:restriction endonuclease S subunit|nr:hypothetical protein [Bacteroidales bacterium]